MVGRPRSRRRLPRHGPQRGWLAGGFANSTRSSSPKNLAEHPLALDSPATRRSTRLPVGPRSSQRSASRSARFPSIDRLRQLLPGTNVEVLSVPRDCQDGFMAALWAQPDAYLDPAIRAATSPWHDLPPTVVERALGQLRKDLDTGEWKRRNHDLLTRPELDVGLRLITSEKANGGRV